MSTGLGEGVATPHARLPGVARPMVALGLFSGAGSTSIQPVASRPCSSFSW
ncbi:MAG: PTS sugar transporter subunit IIA [Deltaproteobacteria bacterium]|nr:PTS sugar transporter subunit IIA [Deltaproteobacteria bacterium]NCS73344.1 PTS sugar transporter subunit IIA [Deltaproteobacteria bacterium]PJB94625.1 MAG: hypothetical protein CO080_11975 [Nitrospirae bacterium CG_4_9_14_0_8_um_filter_70_14]